MSTAAARTPHGAFSRLWQLAAACLLAAGAGFAIGQPLGVGQFPIGARFVQKETALGKRYMVSAAHPLAAEAGERMLRRGGSAVDAAIAVQLVLGLVEPHSSGIGGGAFLLHLEGKSGKVEAYDGRETAPTAVGPGLFMDPGNKPMQFREALVGGRSVGVPGVFRLAEAAHRKHGRLPWAALFEPAIRLAENGYPIGHQLARWLAADTMLKRDPEARALYFEEDGASKPAGSIIRNPPYGRLLREIARHGADRFYMGENAAAMVAEVRAHGTNPGNLSLEDLKNYSAKLREPLCFTYRRYEICSMPPPSSGGIALAQMLGMLENTNFSATAPLSAEAVHLFAEASKLAFADRNRYVADADFIFVPGGLTDRKYLAERSRDIGPVASGIARPGNPPGVRLSRADDQSPELPSTSHLSVVDAYGNAVSMTTSIETIFGAHLMVNGFILNNQLTDFSFVPEQDGSPVANRVEPGKRPRSSMSPTLVLDRDRRLVLTVGSAGGSRIIGDALHAVIGMLDWNLPVAAALAQPRVNNRNGATELEVATPVAGLADALRGLGHQVQVRVHEGGLAGIRRSGDGWDGGADPRRDGTARGE